MSSPVIKGPRAPAAQQRRKTVSFRGSLFSVGTEGTSYHRPCWSSCAVGVHFEGTILPPVPAGVRSYLCKPCHSLSGCLWFHCGIKEFLFCPHSAPSPPFNDTHFELTFQGRWEEMPTLSFTQRPLHLKGKRQAQPNLAGHTLLVGHSPSTRHLSLSNTLHAASHLVSTRQR